VCFDILSVFLSELDPQDPDDFEQIELLKDNNLAMIILQHNDSFPKSPKQQTAIAGCVSEVLFDSPLFVSIPKQY
jgi:hypothetical protein